VYTRTAKQGTKQKAKKKNSVGHLTNIVKGERYQFYYSESNFISDMAV
jgi:hypothetical protein